MHSGIGPLENVSWNGDTVLPFDLPSNHSVFISTHAILQMDKRLDIDSLPRSRVHEWVFESFKFPKVVTHRGQYFLELNLGDIKLGYFIIEIHEGCVLARTFELLTMKGTPEGDKLGALAPITPDKECYNYAGCDRLSLIANLRENVAAKALLQQAGCGHLFEKMDASNCPQPVSTDSEYFLKIFGGEK